MLHLYFLAQEDAAKQLEILQREIQDSTEELHKITPLYNEKVIEEKEISKGYVCWMLPILEQILYSCLTYFISVF